MKSKKCIFLFCIFIFLSTSSLFASPEGDTTETSVPEKSPMGALLRSALVPGWGQWYNGAKLKSILVFGGGMALIGAAVIQNQRAVKSSIPEEREFYQNDRDRFIWYFLGAYLLNLLDAYVDASLSNFDTGPDLSIHSPMSDGKGIIIAICWRF